MTRSKWIRKRKAPAPARGLCASYTPTRRWASNTKRLAFCGGHERVGFLRRRAWATAQHDDPHPYEPHDDQHKNSSYNRTFCIEFSSQMGR